jgi:arsenate reductase
MEKVLFVCGENACRSQMAEAIYNSLARYTRAESAGTLPAPRVNPSAIEVMTEMGLDISENQPKKLAMERLDEYAKIVSFGCIAKGALPHPERVDEWPIEDPSGHDIGFFRMTRDEIRHKVELLIDELEGR